MKLFNKVLGAWDFNLLWHLFLLTDVLGVDRCCCICNNNCDVWQCVTSPPVTLQLMISTVSSVSPSAETPVTAAVHNTRPWLAEADQVTDRLYSHWLILASYWLLYAAAVSAHDGCSLPSSDWLMLVAGMDYCILIGYYRLLIGSKRWANICNIREPPAVTGGCLIVTAYTPSQPFLS